MRVTSSFWVKAYLRQAAIGGCPGAVVRHGDDTAGAVFITVNRLNGTVLLYGPAPAGFSGNEGGERRFVPLHKQHPLAEAAASALLEREVRFDSDVWLIEIESPGGTHFLDGWLLATPN